MKITILLPLALALIISLASVPSAEAQLKLPPVITSAVPDLVNGTLTVRGVNFGDTPARVTLNSIELPILTSGPREIIVHLDPHTPAASYLLVVYRDATPLFGIFIVSIGGPGTPGPQGMQGPRGADGPQGPTGQTGETGPAGATGAQGATGPAGETGPAGPAGKQGPSGATGADGRTGPQGPTGAQGPAGSGGGFSGVREFTASGSLTIPIGVTHVFVEFWGAGGGGGDYSAGLPGGGGGGGAYVRAVVPVTPGTTYDVVVGAGGARGLSGASGTFGGAGSDTKLIFEGTVIVAAAGGAGATAGGAAGGAIGAAGGAGGQAGPIGISRSGSSGHYGGDSGGGGDPFFTPPFVPGAGRGGNGGTSSTNVAHNGADGYALIMW